MTSIEFWVAGEPKAQGRPRAFAMKMGNKYSARVFNPTTAEGWKSAIALAGKLHMPAVPLEGPLRVDAFFVFNRPKSHYRTGRNAHELRESAPEWHTSKPDRDNLDKAVLDALKTLGFFKDDSQVCDGVPQKKYGMHPGVLIRIREAGEA